ncbi:hypothetical protein P280DRAFT_464805 [Massarina eburnea CBS 473.64]|uniref:Uncharacterized protein n=1 Tax=Massarina eburnea CBS 473.64 TaxID=1395130 RepID=A0A6A6SI33_9PLEO|nr:hypothetical protein P280DRAFT_464805 [Massarina eburnea CBS 473.64]
MILVRYALRPFLTLLIAIQIMPYMSPMVVFKSPSRIVRLLVLMPVSPPLVILPV